MSFKKGSEATAEKYVRRGKYRDAIKEYQKLLTGSDEQDLSIRNILGDLFVKANLLDRAVEEFLKIAQHYEHKNIYAKSIALYKRISRLKPDKLEYTEKLADLLKGEGFILESKTEYFQLAQKYSQFDMPNDAIRIYHKLLELDREDIESRLALADLYEREDKFEQTIEELNELAEILMAQKKFTEAKPLLDRARDFQDDHSRTLSNLIDLLTIEEKDEEAFSLVQDILEKDGENIKALVMYGNLLYGNRDFKKAEDIFVKILDLRPGEINARVRLGKIYIREKKVDEAFTLFEPIVESFIENKKAHKAISLLGLIMGAKVVHVPTLEKMAKVYRESGQKENFAVVSKILLSEYRKRNQHDNLLVLLRSLVQMFPEEALYELEIQELKERLGISEKESVSVEPLETDEKTEEMIEANLAKADLYAEQGLVRNAKRILQNLVNTFPEEKRIELKIQELNNVYPEFGLDEIPGRVGRVSQKESQLFPKESESDFDETELDVEKPISVTDLFADTDILPFTPTIVESDIYFDLTGKADEELNVMKEMLVLQKEKGISTFEKPLSEIIMDFKEDLGKTMGEAGSESRYNLGLAFLEQGLWDEAIEEMKIASKETSLALDCYIALSECFKNKQDFKEALVWIEKALQNSEENSEQAFTLQYELASLYEGMGDQLKAMQIFLEVKKWDSDYRDVNKKIKALSKKIN